MWKTEKYKHANMGTFFTKQAQTTCQTRNGGKGGNEVCDHLTAFGF